MPEPEQRATPSVEQGRPVEETCWPGDPADAGLTEKRGVCKISTRETRVVSVYEHESANRMRDHFGGDEAA